MIIKSLARKHPSFDQLVDYCRREAGSPFGTLVDYMRREGVAEVVLARNLGVMPDDRDAVVGAFTQNFERLRERKNGNALYHEVLALGRADGLSKKRQVAMLRDMARVYLDHRAPDCLAYGVVHSDTPHIHMHVVISANAVGAQRRHRLSKSEFAEAQRAVERYRLEKYPELGRDSFYTGERASKGKARASEDAAKRRSGTPSRRERVAEKVEAACRGADSTEALKLALARAGLELYQRGATLGVAETEGSKRRYRLRTLGVDGSFAEAQLRFSVLESRQAELDALHRPRDGRERGRGGRER